MKAAFLTALELAACVAHGGYCRYQTIYLYWYQEVSGFVAPRLTVALSRCN